MEEISSINKRGRSLKARFWLIALLAICLQPLSANQPGKAAIASAHYLATEAGHEILGKGGNAFDAAIGMAAVLSVIEQTSCGIGGGSFWMLHRASDNFQVMIDGREKAPAAAHKDMYLNDDGTVNRDLAVNGPLAAGIPGEIATWEHVATHYGRLPLSESLKPAIRIAREGFPVYTKFHGMLGWAEKNLRRWPAGTEAFLPGGKVPEMGQVIKLPDLALVLEKVALEGKDAFYKGELARQLVDGVREAGGIWSMADLEGYTVEEREPVRTIYHGYELVTAPPPSSGGIAIAEMLNIIEPFKVSKLDRVQRTHVIVEAMRRAYRDRALYLGDPDFYPVPVEMLVDHNYAAGLRASIRLDRATPSSMLSGREMHPGGSDTSHFSLMDAEGNMVAATLTVNTPFGSKFMVPGTGFVLNNEMNDFSAKKGEPNEYGLIGFTANEIQPHKRPLSSMSPTLIFGEERVAALGTPGGSRIITMVLLGILDFLEGNGPESWVDVPRFHHQYVPDKISTEPDALTPQEIAGLEALGHKVEVRNRRWGNMHGVMWDLKTGEVSAGSDKRSDAGKAIVK